MKENLNDLRAFLVVARVGSFTRAAQLLGVSQSALSHCIRGIEDRLHIKLLQRTTRQLKITPEGKTYYRHATKLLEALECADNAVRQYKQRLDGSLHLAAPALIARRKKSDPDDTHNSPEAQERWVRAAEHPNEEDRAAAREFVHKMEHKLDLLEKFRQAQAEKKTRSIHV